MKTHTLHSLQSALQTHWLDVFISLTIILHPPQAQVQYNFAEQFTQSSATPLIPLRHRVMVSSCKYPYQSDTPLAYVKWSHLMNWLTRRIWAKSAGELNWITFPLLLECQCISVRGCWLMLHNCGTDGWPWLQISSTHFQIRFVVKWSHICAIKRIGNNVH